ncbi:alpha-glucosidase [Lactococcus insecticola]|uniref:Alpha-amylase n=1 Tax=Pseudolactococcus insecticola TaxID=2709158 RepID=A0A6A0B7K6_9LACT|nr:alpha-glucosidase [Lactococcus insecticola]GFH39767.1 alpha-amylase [Lactococcus insecticola]
MKSDWFKQAVGYQIYPKSFRDANADGMGDIRGIIEKLPYLKALGVDFIWVNPIYKSPQVDGGYDISDYYAVDERFGSMTDLTDLIAAAHDQGLKLIMDLVVNHTSDQHPWFIESRKSKDNPYRDYYHWQPATPDHLPNDWISFFGGSTWTIDEATGEAYFHVFAKEQPDLNWHNPKVRTAIYEMVRYWLTLGIDGFRLDAISHIEKAPWDFKLKSFEDDDPWEPFMNVSGIEAYMQEFKAIFDAFDALTVGEASGVSSKAAPDWTDAEKGYIDMIFQLEQNKRLDDGHGDVAAFKEVLIRWQEDMQARGWNALYLENHDNPRVIDSFGDGSMASAKAFAVAYMLLRGTPYIYQGQEIGMTNFDYTSISQVDATDTIYDYEQFLAKGLSEKEALSQATQNTRDNARTPMQWDATQYAGFSKHTPWLPVNPNYLKRNVASAMASDTSIFQLYQFLIRLRHKQVSISHGQIRFLFKETPAIFAYTRGNGSERSDEFIVLTNLSDKAVRLDFDSTISDFSDYICLAASQAQELSKSMILEGWDYLIYQKNQNKA